MTNQIKNFIEEGEKEEKGFTPHSPAYPCHFGQECSCNKPKICLNCGKEMSSNCIKYCSNKCAYEVMDKKAKYRKQALSKNKLSIKERIQKLLHDKLGWGIKGIIIAGNDCGLDFFPAVYTCRFCNYKLMQDSSGSWFHLSEKLGD